MPVPSNLFDQLLHLVPVRIHGSEGITSKELSLQLGKSHSHVCQLLSTLRSRGLISSCKERHNLSPLVTYYFRKSDQVKNPTSSESHTVTRKANTCGICQRFTAIGRCVLLDLVADKNPGYLPDDLLSRWKAECISSKTPACDFYDSVVLGRSHYPDINHFYKQNVLAGVFYCSIPRCRQPISELSFPFRFPRLGFSPFFCPHCGSPMVLKYNDYLGRLDVRYFDARYDILQRDYRSITGKFLPPRKNPKRFGISVRGDFNWQLDLYNELIFLGNSSEEDSSFFAYFPLKELDYIATNTLLDYSRLVQALHAEYEIGSTGEFSRLYPNLEILSSKDRPCSFPPTDLELGGNEMIILDGSLNPICLSANILTRSSAVLASLQETTSDCKSSFKISSEAIQEMITKYSSIDSLDFRYWQQLEGGCGSLMYEPFKLEARKYGFFAPARSRARMVREDFFPYGRFYGCSDYHSAINGVNLIGNSMIKELVYNHIEFPFDGIRGWCHQGYSLGLFYDNSEQFKTIALVKINQAIREGVLLPSHFVERRGKCFDKLSCI